MYYVIEIDNFWHPGQAKVINKFVNETDAQALKDELVARQHGTCFVAYEVIEIKED